MGLDRTPMPGHGPRPARRVQCARGRPPPWRRGTCRPAIAGISRRLCPCVDLPFDDPVEAVERAFEAAETQFVVRAGRQTALDTLGDREVLRQGADGDVVVLAPVPARPRRPSDRIPPAPGWRPGPASGRAPAAGPGPTRDGPPGSEAARTGRRNRPDLSRGAATSFPWAAPSWRRGGRAAGWSGYAGRRPGSSTGCPGRAGRSCPCGRCGNGRPRCHPRRESSSSPPAPRSSSWTTFRLPASSQAKSAAIPPRKPSISGAVVRFGGDPDPTVGLGAAQALQAQDALVDAGEARGAVRNALEGAAVVPGPGVIGTDKAAPAAACRVDQPGASMAADVEESMHRACAIAGQ